MKKEMLLFGMICVVFLSTFVSVNFTASTQFSALTEIIKEETTKHRINSRMRAVFCSPIFSYQITTILT